MGKSFYHAVTLFLSVHPEDILGNSYLLRKEASERGENLGYESRMCGRISASRRFSAQASDTTVPPSI
jgi:hypothetical protein